MRRSGVPGYTASLDIAPDAVYRLQVRIIATLVLLDIVVYNLTLIVSRPIPGFLRWLQGFVQMTGEWNLPTWYISVLSALCGLLLLILATSSGRSDDRRAGLGWALLGLACFWISIDEYTQLHERAGTWIGDYTLIQRIPLLWDRPWTVPVFFVVVIFLVFLVPFLKQLPRPTLLWFLLAGGVYVSGAVGVELFTAWSRQRLLLIDMQMYLPILEEMLEKLGFAIFLWAILIYMGNHFRSLEFEINPSPDKVAVLQ